MQEFQNLKLQFFGLYVALSLSGLFFGQASHAQSEGVLGYRLGTGDKISIVVLNEESLSVEARISDVGTISYPFLGEIRVSGLTVGALEDRIRSGLTGAYLVDPKVNIQIVEYRPIFVDGEVRTPKSFAYLPGLNVRKAITMAGGMTDRASDRKIYIIRGGNSGQETIKADLNTSVQPGDIISVGESFF